MKNTNIERVWTIVSCQCSKIDEDFCSWLYFEQGALGLEILDLDKETRSIRASFRPKDLSKEKFDELRHRLKEASLSRIAETLKVETLANQDWLSNWKKHFEPFTVGNSFLVCPPWQSKNIPDKLLASRKKIIIDPGMAFGTGLHATTRFCLQAIEQYAKGPNILDVGTGSGILAIACTLTIAKSKILALDIDRDAMANAKHNIELNHVEKRIELHLNNTEVFDDLLTNNENFDTILSNLTAEAIIDLLPTYNKLLNADGCLILAGIIEERLSILESALAKFSLKSINKTIDQGWIGLVLTKH